LQNLKKTLYVKRPLLNGSELVKWAKQNGFKTTLEPEDMHVTITYSKKAVVWPEKSNAIELGISGGASERKIELFGEDKNIAVLTFRCRQLEKRWEQFKSFGCSYDFPEYRPHVTISYSGKFVDLNTIKPYTGLLKFGEEVFKEVDEDYKEKIKEV